MAAVYNVFCITYFGNDNEYKVILFVYYGTNGIKQEEETEIYTQIKNGYSMFI